MIQPAVGRVGRRGGAFFPRVAPAVIVVEAFQASCGGFDTAWRPARLNVLLSVFAPSWRDCFTFGVSVTATQRRKTFSRFFASTRKRVCERSPPPRIPPLFVPPIVVGG